MQVRSLGFRTDLMLRILAGSAVQERDGWVVVRTPEIPTYWWGNFLLSAVPMQPGAGRRWESAFTRFFPDAGHRAFGVDSADGDAGDPGEITALGLSVELSEVLVGSAVRQPANVSVACRLLDGPADWEQAMRLRLDTDDGPRSSLHRQFLQARVAQEQRVVAGGHGGWFGAFADGRMVSGLGVFSDGAGVARYQSVMTAPDWRRRGLASRLLFLAGEYAREVLHADTLVIVADPDGPALKLYRSLGFTGVQRQVQLQRKAEERNTSGR